ncbi:MAG: hypothetical protein SGI88_19675 [Candidatus Hydrogenedentes bacterium]|nr:hypothetical protein [Candidatus Hydrogenedentota bacterium]
MIPRLRHTAIICFARVLPIIMAATAQAHPGSGIVVDDKGLVYFVHAQVGIWKIDRKGELGKHDGPAFHFMTQDRKKEFEARRLPRVESAEVVLAGTKTKLILSSSFPLTIGSDGNLYYPICEGEGPVQMMRMTPKGETTLVATLPPATEIGMDGKPLIAKWIHGLAPGRDGVLYYSEKEAVRRIGPDGAITMVADKITVPDCEHPPAIPDDRGGPVLRGLDVAEDGSIYVAASACSALVKISPTGKVSVALRSTDAWSPTGVAIAGKDIYVLESLYVKSDQAKDWLPRIRKIAADGQVTVLATVPAQN